MTTGFTFSYHHCYDFTWLLCLWQKQIRQRPTIKLIFDNPSPSPPPSPPSHPSSSPSPPPFPTRSSFSSFSSCDPLFYLILLLHLHLLQLMTMYTCTMMSKYVFAENSCFEGLTRVKLCFSGWEEKSSKSCLFTSQWRKEGWCKCCKLSKSECQTQCLQRKDCEQMISDCVVATAGIALCRSCNGEVEIGIFHF